MAGSVSHCGRGCPPPPACPTTSLCTHHRRPAPTLPLRSSLPLSSLRHGRHAQGGTGGKIVSMFDSPPPRRAHSTDLWSWRWLSVAAFLIAAQAWLLYSPASSSSVGQLSSTLDTILRPLPGPTSPQEPGFDKIAHLSSFAFVTAALLAACLPMRWVVAANLTHALASEIIQGLWIPGRSGDWHDLVADSVGVVFAASIFALARRQERNYNHGY